MEAARREVNHAKEVKNVGLNGFHRNQVSCDANQFQMNQQTGTNQNNSNLGIVPMDIDATTTSIPFQKLMDEE